MLAPLLTWAVATMLGQVPAEAAWTKAVPADVDVVIRVKAIDSVHDELMAMLEATSPSLAKSAKPGLEAQINQFKQTNGEESVKHPFVTLMNIKPSADGSEGPFAILVLVDDYKGVLESISGGKEPKLTPQDGGYDAFDHDGGKWFACKGDGFVGFGPDKGLIAAVAKPGAKTLDKVLTPALVKAFFAGDVGAYVNAAALTKRYNDQIDQARQGFFGMLDAAGQQMGNADAMKTAKEIYGGMFDAVKKAEALTLSFDFDAKGLVLAGELTVQPDTSPVKAIQEAKTGKGDELAKLPADSTFYAYLNISGEAIQRLQKWGLSIMSAGGKNEAMEKAAEAMKGQGPVESYASVKFGKGIETFSVYNVSDPKKYSDATLKALEAMASGKGAMNLYKEVKSEPNAVTYHDISFTKTTLTMDLDKFAKMQGNNPAAVASLKAMLGDGKMIYWTGGSEKKLFQVVAPNWDDAKSQLDAYFEGKAVVGSSPSFEAVRQQLPEQASLLVFMSAQGLVKMIANQLSTTLNRPDLKAPADLGKEPALMGASVTPTPPNGVEFHVVIPSSVGPVFEKGMVPIIQGMQGQVNQ